MKTGKSKTCCNSMPTLGAESWSSTLHYFTLLYSVLHTVREKYYGFSVSFIWVHSVKFVPATVSALCGNESTGNTRCPS